MKRQLCLLFAAFALSACGPEDAASLPPSTSASALEASQDGSQDAAQGAPQEALGADIAFREGNVQLSTGVRLHFVEQGRAEAPVLILLHGYTDSYHSFDLDYDLLPRRYHVYALDQRGHGDSSRPGCCYTQDVFASDVVAFLDAKGIQKAVLLGHSFGSFVAQQVALNSPQRVQALVLVGSAPTAKGNPAVTQLKSAVDTLEDPIDPGFVRDFQASTFYRPIPQDFLDTAVSESLKVPARVWKATLNGLVAEDHSARLKSIRVPVLVVGGDKDSIFSVTEMRSLAQGVFKGTLLLYANTGHAPHVELPQRFVKDVTAFLDGLAL